MCTGNENLHQASVTCVVGNCGKNLHHKSEHRPTYRNQVGKESKFSEPERSMRKLVASFLQQTKERYRIGEVRENNTTNDHAYRNVSISDHGNDGIEEQLPIESRSRYQVKTSQNRDDCKKMLNGLSTVPLK
jgi:hypothetical protein